MSSMMLAGGRRTFARNDEIDGKLQKSCKFIDPHEQNISDREILANSVNLADNDLEGYVDKICQRAVQNDVSFQKRSRSDISQF